MPTYEFRAPDGTIIERSFRMSEVPASIPLPDGSGEAVRIISGGSGLIFKGSGFYITDYGKDGKKDQRPVPASGEGGSTSAAESGSKPESGSKGDSASESKSEKKADGKGERSSEGKAERKSGDSSGGSSAAPSAASPKAPSESKSSPPAGSKKTGAEE